MKRTPAQRKARVDLNLAHLDPWTALESISIHAHKALIMGRRDRDWQVLSVILGKCNAMKEVRAIITRKKPRK